MGLADRHHSVQHLVDLLEPNPNLPDPLFRVADVAACHRDKMLELLQDGPELAAGLRKLLEARAGQLVDVAPHLGKLLGRAGHWPSSSTRSSSAWRTKQSLVWWKAQGSPTPDEALATRQALLAQARMNGLDV